MTGGESESGWAAVSPPVVGWPASLDVCSGALAGGADGAASLLLQHPDLTALICLNDRMAMGAVQQAYHLGKRVPDQLTIVGYDDIPAAEIMVPSLTTINQQALTLGYEASRILFEVLNGQSPESKVIPVELVARGSSAPPADQ